MNPHLNTFYSYKEYDNPIENNLTRAFLVTLKNEPELGRAFFCQLTGEYPWEGIYFGLQETELRLEDFDFERVIGVALTAGALTDDQLAAEASGAVNPRPDFLLYTGKTLIVSEVKKHAGNAAAQLKNQVERLLASVEDVNSRPTPVYKSLTWTEVLSILIFPYEQQCEREGKPSPWASDFREYITAHYTGWLPVPSLDKIAIGTGPSNTATQLAERRLYTIQSLTEWGAPESWIGGRWTMPLKFGWATEAMVKVESFEGVPYVCVTIWPGDTKHQGWQLFHKGLSWAQAADIIVGDEKYELDIIPYAKFAHFMGKYIGRIGFGENAPLHSLTAFHRYAGRWDRSEWEALEAMLDADLGVESKWRDYVGWEKNLLDTARGYLFLSLGFECTIYLPYVKLQAAERTDPSGQRAAGMITETVGAFRALVDGV